MGVHSTAAPAPATPSAAGIRLNDNQKLFLGTGDDAEVYYDGTDLILAPAAVGSGDIVVSGGSLEFDDSEGVTLGTGKDATLVYDGTDLVVSPAAVGAGDLVVSGASIEFDDSEGVTLGTGKDATIQYDGTNLVIDSAVVGSGVTVFPQSIRLDGSTSGEVTLSVGATPTTGTLTLPSGTDTLVGRDTTDTLTAKTLTSPVIGTQITLDQTTADYTLTWANPAAARAISIPDPGGTDLFVFRDMTQTLAGKTLTSPDINGGTWNGTIDGASTATANLTLNDNVKLLLGTGVDASLYYDATNLVIDPKEVGSGRVSIQGDVEVANGNGLVVGHTAQVTGIFGITTSEMQVLGTSGNDGSMLFARFAADSNEPFFVFLKSRDPAIADGTFAIVQNGDGIGAIEFVADDGVDYATWGASIQGIVDGTPGENDLPMALLLKTTRDGASSPTEAVRVTAQQSLLLLNTGPNIAEPTANPANRAGIYCVDLSAGNATLGILTETAVAVEAASASTHTLSVRVNGATYRIMLTNA